MDLGTAAHENAKHLLETVSHDKVKGCARMQRTMRNILL